MISRRSKASLAQLLALYDFGFVRVLLEKHGTYFVTGKMELTAKLDNAIDCADSEEIFAVLQEIARTKGDLRARVEPRYRFDQRFADLELCLNLDGYSIESNALTRLDPSVSDAEPIEDDLTRDLHAAQLPNGEIVLEKIAESSAFFRSVPPNFNAALVSVRLALEALAHGIANAHAGSSTSTAKRKWGTSIAALKDAGLISSEDERAIAGVYGFISRGAHHPLGLSDMEQARLARALALSICWYLIKLHKTNVQRGY